MPKNSTNDNAGTVIRLNSGAELKLDHVLLDPPHDRWRAGILLTANFHAVDVEAAEECAVAAMIAVMERTLGDLRDLNDDLACLKSS